MKENMNLKSEERFVEKLAQTELIEACPCDSGKCFGACCGGEFLCDCNSKWTAAECCYSEEALPEGWQSLRPTS